MSRFTSRLAGLGALGILLWLAVVLAVVGISIYGLVLAFSASIVVGIIVLIVEPAPFIIGLVALINGTDLAQKILQLIS